MFRHELLIGEPVGLRSHDFKTTQKMMNQDAGTLVEALRSSARSDRAITYINGKSEENELSYRQLLDRARALLGFLHASQVRAGDELVLFVESNEEFVDVFWACLLGGIVAVPLAIGPGDAHIRKLFNVFRKLERPRLYSTSKNLRKIEKFGTALGLRSEYAVLHEATVVVPENLQSVQPVEGLDVRPDQTAFIQFSSGSTGDPKGVVLSHHNVMTNVRGILNGVKIRETDSSLSWMPLTHDMGIIGFHIAPLVACAPLYLMPPELFVRRPLLWLQKISEKRATVTASPNFGYKHVLRRFNAEPGELDLSCLRVVFNGAEPISARLCREFAHTMAPFGYRSEAMFPVYGLAEASLAVTFSDPDSDFETISVRRGSLKLGEEVDTRAEDESDRLELVSVGSAIQGNEVMIADARGRPAPERRVGSIWIRGDNVTAGYYRDPLLNGSVFKPDGWLDTGDLGFLHENRLFIAGREKELIILNGQNFHPHDLESICESSASIEPGRVAALGLRTGGESPEALAIFVLSRSPLEEFVGTVREVRRSLSESAGVHAEYVIPVRAIPKTTSGKTQRYLLAEQFQRGEFDSLIDQLRELMKPNAAADQVTDGGIEGILLQICRTVLDEREVGVEENLFELGISSLKLAQIQERIEERFPGLIEINDLFDCPSVRELSAQIEHKQRSGG